MIDPRTIILGEAIYKVRDRLDKVQKDILSAMREDPDLYDEYTSEDFISSIFARLV